MRPSKQRKPAKKNTVTVSHTRKTLLLIARATHKHARLFHCPVLIFPVDSYPLEFIAHHAPLMFVSGLEPPVTAPDAFSTLRGDLRTALDSRTVGAVWDPSRVSNSDFRVVFVDQSVRFPPTKAPADGDAPRHSPLSPLTPASPLFPDGIMAPVWVRKHRDMVPAVFVLVLRLYEGEAEAEAGGVAAGTPLPSNVPAPGNASAPPPQFADEAAAQFHYDTLLAQQILARKHSTAERGIKLAVVLLCSRAAFADAGLDARLSHIRRQATLDARASLFVLSPVPPQEVANFAENLRRELFGFALDCYREHGRRVRRKRARHVPRGRLSDRGWNVRYDYKMAFFLELRGESDVALRHYGDAYAGLLGMFETGALPPRSKRWAEAKVLADCLMLKTAKLHLYAAEPSRAMLVFNRHIAAFRTMSTQWGIGEKTFEFWSWLSKQFRLLADLIALAIRGGFRLPAPFASLPADGNQYASSMLTAAAGSNPALLLQHPGYYLYFAALCARERHRWFVFALSRLQDARPVRHSTDAPSMDRVDSAKAEAAPDKVQSAAPQPTPSTPPMPPALANESKANHYGLIVDLLSKAYDFYHAQRDFSTTVFVVSQIADTHFEFKNYKTAIQLYERVLKSYRKSKTSHITRSLLSKYYLCSTYLSDAPLRIAAIIELLGKDMGPKNDARKDLVETLKNLLASPLAEGENALLSINMSERSPLLTFAFSFWDEQVPPGERVHFQASLASETAVDISDLAFNALTLQMSDGTEYKVAHSDDAEGIVSRLDSDSTCLKWTPYSTRYFTGALVPAQASGRITPKGLVLQLHSGARTVDFVFTVPQTTRDFAWGLNPNKINKSSFTRRCLPSCEIQSLPPKVKLNVTSDAPAYLNERFPITVDVYNESEKDILHAYLDILLQPPPDDSIHLLSVDDQQSSSMIRSLDMGVVQPLATVKKVFYMTCSGNPGERFLDVSVRVKSTGENRSSLEGSQDSDDDGYFETLASVTISVLSPIVSVYNMTYYACQIDQCEKGYEGWSKVMLVATLSSESTWDLVVERIALNTDASDAVKLLTSSLEHLEFTPQVWKPDDKFNVIFQLLVAPEKENASLVQGLFLDVAWKRTESADLTTNKVAIPPIRRLPLTPNVTVKIPSFIKMFENVTIDYVISNPLEEPLNVALVVENQEGFVYGGPRRAPNLIIAPHSELSFPLTLVAIQAGTLFVPRVRIFAMKPPQAPVGAPAQQVELDIIDVSVPQDVKDEAQIELELDLKVARGEGNERPEPVARKNGPSSISVVVLP